MTTLPLSTELDALLEASGTYSAFADHRRHLATGVDLDEVVAAAQRAMAAGEAEAVAIFDDATGNRTEAEPAGGAAGVRERLGPAAGTADAGRGEAGKGSAGPGRPRLGVVSREVSLLPRHWDWLAAQPGGASAALRRLVDEARRRYRAQDAHRVARDAAGKAMAVLAGSLPGYEEALRALYADQPEALGERTAGWPDDLRAHLLRLAAIAARLHALALREAESQGPHPVHPHPLTPHALAPPAAPPPPAEKESLMPTTPSRSERKLAYKLAEPAMGVCAVRNLRNGKVYLERTLNTEGLLNRLRFTLKLGGHHVPALQADWNAQGGDDFAFEVLERLAPPPPNTPPKDALAALEAKWLARLAPYGEQGYHRPPG